MCELYVMTLVVWERGGAYLSGINVGDDDEVAQTVHAFCGRGSYGGGI